MSLYQSQSVRIRSDVQTRNKKHSSSENAIVTTQPLGVFSLERTGFHFWYCLHPGGILGDYVLSPPATLRRDHVRITAGSSALNQDQGTRCFAEVWGYYLFFKTNIEDW